MPLSNRHSLPYDQQLQLDHHYANIHNVCAAQPPPLSSDPDDTVARDNAIVAIIASLVPVGAAEATLAGRYAVASAQAIDAMRRAMLAADDLIEQERCMRWNLHYSRHANSCMNTLLRAQEDRRRREATLNGANRDVWVEHCAVGNMASALGRSGRLTDHVPTNPGETPDPVPDPPKPDLTDAELYASTYPDRARQIRELGGAPFNTVWMPPSKSVIDELLTSDSPIIQAALAPRASQLKVSPSEN